MFFAAVAVMAAGSFAAGPVASADAVISPGDLQPAPPTKNWATFLRALL